MSQIDAMKIFITGCTGFIGSRVLEQLLAGGSKVSALVRSEAAAQDLTSKGVRPVMGDLKNLDIAASAAKEADAILHLAFIHDFSKYMESIATDLAFIEHLLSALAGSGKRLIITSGTAMLGDSGKDLHVEGAGSTAKHPRGQSEAIALKGLEQDIQVFVLRLPIYVYDESSFISFMANLQVEAAKKMQTASYIGSGFQKFSVVHVEDAASAYVAAASTSAQPGIYHLAGERGITAQQLASAISKKLSLPVRSMSHEEAGEVYKGLAELFSISNDVDSSKAQRELKWQPKHTRGFLDAVASVQA